jgi:putative effector of murein hydrolase LrgA (UPF0299 family)
MHSLHPQQSLVNNILTRQQQQLATMSDTVIEIFVVALTLASTASTVAVFTNCSNLLRQTAVIATLVMLTIVLIIEILFHITRPRSEDLQFAGPEYLVIALFCVYEYVPNLCEWGICGLTAGKGCIEWSFAILGLVIAFFSLAFGLQLLGDLQRMADTINEYGLLFVIPTVGVGELVNKWSMRSGSGWGCALVVNVVLFTPFMVLFFSYLPTMTALAYLTSGIAFFTDIFLGVRRGDLVFWGEDPPDDNDDDDDAV